MLGIRLMPEDEGRLARFAREAQRPKSAVVRGWILERLDREEIDRKIATAAALDHKNSEVGGEQAPNEATAGWLRLLDAEDGGYDWGPGGPPDVA
jgi:predicted transcriptional regulator